MKNKEWYGVGLSNEDRSAKFEIWVDDMGGEDNIDIICIDGSAFDSTQHRELLQTLDQELLKVIFKEFEHEIHQYCNPEHVYQIITNTRQLISGEVYDRKDDKIEKDEKTKIQMWIDGTVTSGQMMTSCGNCNRSAAYIETAILGHNKDNEEKLYTKQDGNHSNINFEVCGDDVIVFIAKNKTQDFIKALKKYVYADTTGIRHGLGQIAKTFDVYDKLNKAEYLSCSFLTTTKDKAEILEDGLS